MSSHLVIAMRTLAFLVFAFGLASGVINMGDLPPDTAMRLLVLAQTLGLYLISAVGLWVGAEIVNAVRRSHQTP